MRIGRKIVLCVAPILAAALVACDDDDNGPAGPGPGTSDFEWSGQVAQGLAIEIKGISGSISASLTSGSQVEVFATKEGQQSDPSTVTIEVVEHAGGVTICAVYPDVPGQPPNECAPGLEGNMSVQDNDVEVTFAVRVPAGVDFVGRTISGNVSAIGLQSDAFGYVVSGNVDLTTTEIAEGRTVSGSVDVTLGEANPGRDLEFATTSGSVTLRIPSDTNAEIRATVASGSLSSDFQLTETSPGIWEATLGSGGPTLSLSSVSGSVTLLSGS
jgi:hypothetical protein